MSHKNVEIVKSLYAAFSRGDVEGVLGVMSPDIVWNEADDFPYADDNPYHGPMAVAEGVFGRTASEWDEFGVEVAEILDAGETVIALGRYVGTFKATGKPQNTQVAHVWRLSDGKITQFQQYANTLHVARVTGAV
jgi:ketosteroid isomerase-like protein